MAVMEIDVLGLLEIFQTKLAEAGFSVKTLLILGGVALVLFVLSARQVMLWFLKIHHLRNEVKHLHQKIDSLHIAINELRGGGPHEPTPLRPEEKKESRFRLDH
jgi:hypothetical protein